jgi:hypothetical protein
MSGCPIKYICGFMIVTLFLKLINSIIPYLKQFDSKFFGLSVIYAKIFGAKIN